MLAGQHSRWPRSSFSVTKIKFQDFLKKSIVMTKPPPLGVGGKDSVSLETEASGPLALTTHRLVLHGDMQRSLLRFFETGPSRESS